MRITGFRISGYRSIKDEISIKFPEGIPVVFLGENNAGKSNIVRALDLILGEFWPGNREPEDHEFWDRDKSTPIKISIDFEETRISTNSRLILVNGLDWAYDHNAQHSDKCTFNARTNRSTIRASNIIRDQCMCVHVGADRRLSYQLSYTSKYTMLSKLMKKFHNNLVEDGARVNRLRVKFCEITDIFEEVSEFAAFSTELKKELEGVFAGMTYGLKMDFSAYDPSRFFNSLRVYPYENDNVRNFEELGTGQEQVLALAFAHAYGKAFHGGIVLCIEEPEAHLHPLAQQWLSRKINQMAKDGLQIVLTTHSPAFLNLLNLEGLVLVRKKGNATLTKQLTGVELGTFCKERGAKTNSDTILPFYASSAREEILAGFFAQKVVLVEGATEALTLPIYLKNVELDVTKEGIAIIPVYGKGNIAKWWRLFSAYEIPVYVIFDNDKKHDSEAIRRKDALKTIGIPDKEVENLCSTDDWLIKERFSIFGVDFETALRNNFGESLYDSFVQKATEEMGSESKPIIARYVAEKLIDSGDPFSDGSEWTKFRKLSEKIRNLNAPRSLTPKTSGTLD